MCKLVTVSKKNSYRHRNFPSAMCGSWVVRHPFARIGAVLQFVKIRIGRNFPMNVCITSRRQIESWEQKHVFIQANTKQVGRRVFLGKEFNQCTQMQTLNTNQVGRVLVHVKVVFLVFVSPCTCVFVFV